MSIRHPLDLLVRSLTLRVPLSEADRNALLALPHTRACVDPSDYLVREGEPPTMCAVIISGFAYRQKLTGDGNRQIVALHMPGDAVDFQNLYHEISDHSVQMLSAGEVAFVPRSALQALARSHLEVAQAIFRSVLVEASIFREWIVNVGSRQARERIAHILCEIATRLDSLGLAEEYGYELPMTQEQFADAVGLTTVHVNRTLRALETEGLITRDKRKISFPDWRKLCAAADFNGRYLHL